MSTSAQLESHMNQGNTTDVPPWSDRRDSSTWRPDYDSKVKSGEKALRLIRRGQRVFIGSGCGEPQHLVRTLEQVAAQLADLEILHLLSLGTTTYTGPTSITEVLHNPCT